MTAMIAFLIVALCTVFPAQTQQTAATTLKAGAKVFVHHMENDFDTYFKAALQRKKVPVVVVSSPAEADFEIKGSAESQKASAAKKIILGSWHSDEQASISVTSVQSGEVVFAYSANKKNSAHGKQTTAEACAKHLKEAIEKGR
jgi:hypothetical protein